MSTRPRTLLFILAISIAAVACTATKVENAPTATPTTGTPNALATATAGQATAIVNLVMRESSITSDRTTAQSGEITFRVQNAGTVKHQFLVVKTDLAPNALPMVSDGSKVDESKLDKVVSVPAIDPGKSDDPKVRLAPGKYALLSNDPTQYKAGMVMAFTVTP